MYLFFFFNDTATTEIYTLSLHDALPISNAQDGGAVSALMLYALEKKIIDYALVSGFTSREPWKPAPKVARSEEHTSELQSQSNLVCRLLLEKKKKKNKKREIVRRLDDSA